LRCLRATHLRLPDEARSAPAAVLPIDPLEINTAKINTAKINTAEIDSWAISVN